MDPFKPEGDPKAEHHIAAEQCSTQSLPYYSSSRRVMHIYLMYSLLAFMFKAENHPHASHIHSAVISIELFYLINEYFTSNISLSSTFPPHQLTLATGKAQSWLAIS